MIRVRSAIIAGALLTPAVFANLRTGQAYLFVAAVFGAFAVALVRERSLLAGTLLGFVFAVKSAGAPLLLLLFLRRRCVVFLAAGAAALILALFVSLLVPLETWLRYLAYVSEFINRPTASATAYQTTWSLMRRICSPDAHWNPEPAANCARLASIAPALLLAFAIVVTAIRVHRAPLMLWIAAGIALSVIDVPLAVDQHFVTLAIPAILPLGGPTGTGPRAMDMVGCFSLTAFCPADLHAAPLHQRVECLARLAAALCRHRSVDHDPAGMQTH